jgi:putative spermidine/putrescine transport system substrate-binding protein
MYKLCLAAATCAAIVAVAACGSDEGGGGSKSGGSITVAGFGGAYGDAEKAAYWDPFTKATGIQVKKLEAEVTLGAVKLQVQKGAVVWDLVELSGPDAVAGCRNGIVEKVDYSQVARADLVADAGYKCGVSAGQFTEGIGYRTDKIKKPPTWQDFFDTEAYPGKRTMEKYLQDGTLEYALLADGVPKDKLYPLDVNRAITKLKSLGDDVIFVDSLAQASQLLTSGEAVMIQSASGRMIPLINAGLPVGFEPNGERAPFVFTIPKGAKNAENAMKFLKFVASCASCSQTMARLTGYSGPNKDGDKGLSAGERAYLPTNPSVVAKSFPQDIEWWTKNAEEAQAAFDKFFGS